MKVFFLSFFFSGILMNAHAAHVHGEVQLDFVLDKNKGAFYLKAPLDDLYQYSREEKKQRIDHAMDTFNQQLPKLLGFPQSLGCKLIHQILNKKETLYSKRHTDLEIQGELICSKEITSNIPLCFEGGSFEKLRKVRLTLSRGEKALNRLISIEKKESCPHVNIP